MKDIIVFNRQHLSQQRKRAANAFKDHEFLFDWAGRQIIERLKDITRSFETCIGLGNRVPQRFWQEIESLKQVKSLFVSDLWGADVIADHEILPFANASADLIVSVLDLHTVNDLPGSLAQIRHILKPDGLFLGCILGGESLFELRESLMQTEIALYDGASPRVAPFADKPQIGNLLQRAGFALPVIDSDIIRVSYPAMFNLMADLRGMGESNSLAARRKNFTPPRFFAEAADYYQAHFPDEDGRIKASFEVIFMTGWSPHDSQQKPLRPGSAKNRLADMLGVAEIKT